MRVHRLLCAGIAVVLAGMAAWSDNAKAQPAQTAAKPARGVEDLIKDLGNEDPAVSVKAIAELVAMGKTAVPALMKVFLAGDELAAPDAADALGKIGDKSIAPDLIEALRQPNIRGWARDVLDKLVDKSMAPRFAKLLKEEKKEGEEEALVDPFVRNYAIEALGKLGGPEARTALVDLLTAEDYGTRRRAAAALGTMRDVQTVPALMDKLTDDCPWVSHEAWLSLKRITGQAIPFHAEGPPEDRRKSISEWRQWWAERTKTKRK